MAIKQGLCVAFRPTAGPLIRALSEAQGCEPVQFALPVSEDATKLAGNWGNYLQAAALLTHRRYGIENGLEAAVSSDLPLAAGLSSSSALLIVITLALLRANRISPSLSELMEVLPDGEQYVGTRGGGMDHAAILASTAGHALRIGFKPFTVTPVAIPPEWSFLIIDSGEKAEKSAAIREQYNFRREAGNNSLRLLNLSHFRELDIQQLPEVLQRLPEGWPRAATRHVMTEADRVTKATAAMQAGDLAGFGELLNESHRSLRDDLRVSTAGVDLLVQRALAAGAVGARITGAGFGGCIIALCSRSTVQQVITNLNLGTQVLVAEPAAGALHYFHDEYSSN